MATSYKILGQVNPSATTNTDVYTVPAASSAVVSTISITSLDASSQTFRIAFRKAGASIDNKQYLAYNTTIAALDTVVLTLGITLAATDVITVYASNANLVFQVFGSEIA